MTSVQGTLRARKAPRKVLAQATHDLAASTSQDSNTQPATPSATTHGHAMDAVLSELLSTHLGDVPRIWAVVADGYAHLDVVRGDFSCSSDRQLDAIANACISELLGDNASRQTIRWQLQQDQQHLLISSIEEKEVSGILEVASTHRLKVHSIQPDFVVQWNFFAGGKHARNCVFATVNEGRATVAFAKNGVITSLSSGPCVIRKEDMDDQLRSVQCVDERTNRLLTSIGQAFDDVSSFVLVTREPHRIPEGSRWTALNLSEDYQ
jgi:hypothetical protein